MKKIEVEAVSLSSIVWPDKCSTCGRDIPSEIPAKSKTGNDCLKLTRRCDECAKKIISLELMCKAGVGIMSLAFIGAVTVSVFNVVYHHVFSDATRYVFGAAFWLGAIMSWVGGVGLYKGYGIQCERKKNGWQLLLRNEAFSDAFERANSTAVRRK